MAETDNTNTPAKTPITDSLKSWTMAVVTLVFVALYALSIAGIGNLTSHALKDLQPIVFVIIGYYFGRLPSQPVENALQEQIRSQGTREDAARSAERTAVADTAAFEERMKAAMAILKTEQSRISSEASEMSPAVIETAIKVLNPKE